MHILFLIPTIAATHYTYIQPLPSTEITHITHTEYHKNALQEYTHANPKFERIDCTDIVFPIQTTWPEGEQHLYQRLQKPIVQDEMLEFGTPRGYVNQLTQKQCNEAMDFAKMFPELQTLRIRKPLLYMTHTDDITITLPSSTLTRLELQQLDLDTNWQWYSAVQNCKSLTYLSLSILVVESPVNLEAQKKLQTLTVSSLLPKDPADLIEFKLCPGLTELTIEHLILRDIEWIPTDVKILTVRDVRLPETRSYGLSKYRTMTHLTLVRSHKLEVMIPCWRRLPLDWPPQLQHLDLGGFLMDDALSDLHEVIRGPPWADMLSRLRTLKIAGNPELQEVILDSFFNQDSFASLEVLHIDALTGISYTAFFSALPATLRELYIHREIEYTDPDDGIVHDWSADDVCLGNSAGADTFTLALNELSLRMKDGFQVVRHFME